MRSGIAGCPVNAAQRSWGETWLTLAGIGQHGPVPETKPEAMACPNCGSWSVRADRSLAGRLVCARCGEPLGIGAGRSGRLAGRGRVGAGGGRSKLWLGIMALVVISAILAALPNRQPLRPIREQFAPSGDRSDGSGRCGGNNQGIEPVSPSADRVDHDRCPSRIMVRSNSA